MNSKGKKLKNKTVLVVKTDRIMLIAQKHSIPLPAPAEGYIQTLLKRGDFRGCKTEKDYVDRLREFT